MSYIPSKEADLKNFGLNFATLTVAAPATYGLVAGDATQIQEAAEDYAAKYDLAVNPATRIAANIDAKNSTRRC